MIYDEILERLLLFNYHGLDLIDFRRKVLGFDFYFIQVCTLNGWHLFLISIYERLLRLRSAVLHRITILLLHFHSKCRYEALV